MPSVEDSSVSPHEEGNESVVVAPVFSETDKTLEIVVPTNVSLSYFEAAIKAGIDRLEITKSLFNDMAETGTVNRIQESITSLYSIIQGVNEIRVENYNERMTFNQQYDEWRENHANNGVTLVQDSPEDDAIDVDDLGDLFDEDTEDL